jgi:hypothetical protein
MRLEVLYLPKDICGSHHTRHQNIVKMAALIHRHGAEVLQHRLARPHALSSILANWARYLIQIVIEAEGSGSQDLQSAYSTDICRALIANFPSSWVHLAVILDYQSFKEHLSWRGVREKPETTNASSARLLPYAAAAVGNYKLFQDTVRPDFDFHEAVDPFPSVLSAAASTGQVKFVQKLLDNYGGQINSSQTRYSPLFASYYP